VEVRLLLPYFSVDLSGALRFEALQDAEPFSANNTADNPLDIQLTPPTASGDSGSSSMCFIATAAYGSYLEPEVVLLRHFRDRYLLTHAPGRAFVRWYYAHSPPVAAVIAAHEGLRTATRWALTPLVYAIKYGPLTLALLLAAGLWLLMRRGGRRPAGLDAA
jgi:hypothetical protein